MTANPATRTTNQLGINLIKEFEGLRLRSYKDAVGIWTVGYGTTRINGKPVQADLTIDEPTAEKYLADDLAKFEQCVRNTIKVDLNSNQFSALVSFVYNLGCGALKKSTLARRLNSGDYDVGNEFLKFNKAGGKVLAGLTRRRKAEKELFERKE